MNFSDLAKKLWPFLSPSVEKAVTRGVASSRGGGGGGLTAHSLSGAYHTGTLDDDQAPQFLMADGTRPLTGNLSVAAGVTIDGVDIGAHEAATGTSVHGLGTMATQNAGAIAVSGGSITGITDLAIADGGTGASSASAARNNLGLGTMATQNANAVAITGGSITGITDLAVADGGTGASTAAGAASNLGVGVEDSPTFAGLTINGNVTVTGTVDGIDVSSFAAASFLVVGVSSAIANERVLTAGPGLTGTDAGAGGAWTLGIGAGTGITVNADDVAVNTAYGFIWTGAHEHREDFAVYNPSNLAKPVFQVDQSAYGVGINRIPDLQFSLDIAGAARADYWVGPHAIQLSDAELIAHFDGPTPYETDFTGVSHGHKGQVATESGGVIFRPGKLGKGVQVAEATTNLVTNPSFETGATGWTNYATGAATGTRTRVTTQSLYGSYAYELVKSGGAATDRYGAYCTFAATSGVTYTVSIWVKVSAISGGTQTIRVHTADAYTATSKDIVGTGDWQRVTLTATATSTATATLYVWIHDATTATVYIDAAQAEAKAYATPYCDGSLGSGHSWSGTAHASTSSRTASKLRYSTEVLNENAGTIMAWIRSHALNDGGRIVSHANTAAAAPSVSSRWYLMVQGGKLRGQIMTGGLIDSTTSLVAGQWHHVAMTWSAGSMAIYLDGVQEATDTYTGTFEWASLFEVGNYSNSNLDTGHSTWFNGTIDDLVILSRASDADEILSIYESNAPVFAESSTNFFKSYGPTPVWADEEGFWVRSVTTGDIFGIYGGGATKSWGGLTLSDGDLMIGRSTGSYIHWDDSDGDIDAVNVGISITDAGYAFRVSNGSTEYILASGDGYFYAGNSSSGGLEDPNATFAVHPTGDVYIGSQSDGDYIKWDEANGRFLLNNAQLRVAGTGSIEHWNGSNQTFVLAENALNVGNLGTGALEDPNSMLIVNTTIFAVGAGDLYYDGTSFDYFVPVSFRELGSAPSNPDSGSEAFGYMKGDKLIISYNHAGTMKYRYMDLTSTNANWTYTTTAP